MSPLIAVAEVFSPRYERHGDDAVVIDVSGLDRLLGPPRLVGDQLRREAANRGLRVHVALAATRIAALVLAHARAGVVIVDPGDEASALAPLPLRVLEQVDGHGEGPPGPPSARRSVDQPRSGPGFHDHQSSVLPVVSRWGLRTLGELAALPAADLRARLGPQGVRWHAMACGEDVRPLVPSCPDERFASSMELEWPIEGAEPLSFVLTRLLEPLSTRLERRDRGAAALHVRLRLVTKEVHARRLQLPSPLRDVRTLRTLALLDLESHPPAAAIDQVSVTIDPTPGRMVQHTLFTRAVPTPDQLATLLARLGALMGQDRIGVPATIDSYRPGAFAMLPFATDHDEERGRRRAMTPVLASATIGAARPGAAGAKATAPGTPEAFSRADSALNVVRSQVSPTVVSALHRCRQPVPARVMVGAGQRPARVTTDRRGFAGGSVVRCAGPWRTSGEWWEPTTGGTDRAGTIRAGGTGGAGAWNRDEWDVALSDGAVYRVFRDRATQGWFIDAIVD
ncbi:MAG: hypothetical protein GEU82_12385 [Luteitalea sp.]|nr:hypothetical protein [Luteitalea sp.]